MKEYKAKLVNEEVKDESGLKMIEGRDIRVCIRARPLLEHEKEQKNFDIVHA